MKSDGDFGRCVVSSDAAVNSDGDFGRCAVNSDAGADLDRVDRLSAFSNRSDYRVSDIKSCIF